MTIHVHKYEGSDGQFMVAITAGAEDFGLIADSVRNHLDIHEDNYAETGTESQKDYQPFMEQLRQINKVLQATKCPFQWPLLDPSEEDRRNGTKHECLVELGHNGDHRCPCGERHAPKQIH